MYFQQFPMCDILLLSQFCSIFISLFAKKVWPVSNRWVSKLICYSELKWSFSLILKFLSNHPLLDQIVLQQQAQIGTTRLNYVEYNTAILQNTWVEHTKNIEYYIKRNIINVDVITFTYEYFHIVASLDLMMRWICNFKGGRPHGKIKDLWDIFFLLLPYFQYVLTWVAIHSNLLVLVYIFIIHSAAHPNLFFRGITDNVFKKLKKQKFYFCSGLSEFFVEHAKIFRQMSNFDRLSVFKWNTCILCYT